MKHSLLDLVRRHADAHADRLGVAETAIAGFYAVRGLHPGELQAAVNRPLVAMLLQGRKRVGTATQSFDFGPGETLVVAADVPTVSQILEASPAAPYYALVLEFDPALLRELTVEAAAAVPIPGPVRVEPTDADVADAALRLMRLLERPAALPVLRQSLLRELHFWLLSGRHGPAIRSLGNLEGHAPRIARAVTLIRAEFAQALRVEQLAEVAGMSVSSFHSHFRTATTLSPLQFQKQLRLIEARRLMLVEGAGIATAAHAVGYASVPQFTRDYARLFGAPPGRDMNRAIAPPAQRHDASPRHLGAV